MIELDDHEGRPLSFIFAGRMTSLRCESSYAVRMPMPNFYRYSLAGYGPCNLSIFAEKVVSAEGSKPSQIGAVVRLS